MATIKEVAERAQVSVATVSRVLNNSGFVSEELRERVLTASTELNYQPSRVAKSLRHQKTYTIGVLVPQLDLPFFARLTLAIQQTLATSNYYTLVASTLEDANQETAYIDMMIGQRVDGVIIVPTGHSATNIGRLVQADVPLVIVDRDVAGFAGVERVLCDNHTGAYDAMRHLLQAGHRDIALIGGPTYSVPIQNRVRGYEQALQEWGIEKRAAWVILDDLPAFDMGYEGAKRIFALDQYPSAIFALSDITAVGVLHAAREVDLTLPEDISLVGFDDIPLAAYCLPPLSTVAQPIYEMGVVAAERLLARIHDTTTHEQRQILPATFVERQSTLARTTLPDDEPTQGGQADGY